MAAKKDKLSLKNIKESNTVLCEYFASYCTHGTSVTGIPINSGTRVCAVLNEVDDQFPNIIVSNALKLKSFLVDAKVTKTEREETDKNIKLTYHSSEGDINIKLPKYTSDIESVKNANTQFQTNIFKACMEHQVEGTPIDRELLDALANKKFVCIGGVIFAKSELPLTHKCMSAQYWKVYANSDDSDFAFNERDDLAKNYFIAELEYEKVTVYKMVAYAFPATEFNI